MKQISKSLVLLFLLAITTCATAPPPPGSLAAIRQEARKAIETECVRALFLKKRKTIYSIEDAYVHARACMYFSDYEGFGNAFVEAVVAKKPIFVNNYKPVYWPDIGSKGFEAVMIENNVLTEKAVSEMKEIISSPKRCREIAEHNFKIGKEHFSYEILDRHRRANTRSADAQRRLSRT